MRSRNVLWALVLVLPLPVGAATIRVPADQPTIQAGINAALDGDTVLVAPGTYFENVVMDRRVALVSEAGAEVTTIDGQNLGPVILVRNSVDHAAIEGFRVTHGMVANGYAAGIQVSLSSNGGYATIRRNIVEHNLSLGGPGGIFAGRHSIIEDNVIQYNSGSKGFSAMEASGTIERNIIRENGFGLYDARISGTDTFAWNIVADNQSGRNVVVFIGGGWIHHNTFVNGDWFYPGVELWEGSSPYNFHNNLIVHGVAGGLDCHLTGSHTIRCNDVWGGGQSYMGDCAGLEGGEGNFSADPLFCDAAHGDYSLHALSLCAPGNSPVGCELIGALPVACGVAYVVDGSPSADLRLRVIPNPVRGVGRFEIGQAVPFGLLSIFDSQGRLVEQLTSNDGHWEWTPRSAPAGIYFAMLEGGTEGMRPVKFLHIR